jgi:hypothetical protein
MWWPCGVEEAESKCALLLWCCGSALKECETSSVLPLRATVADHIGQDAATTKTHMCCVDNGDAQASFDISAYLQVSILPFVSQLCCESFSKGFSFTTEQSVGGANKRSEVASLKYYTESLI